LNKLLEAVILNSFQSCDSYEDELQFGFKHGHSTSLSCSVLKHVVDYYRSRGSYVFACFLDLSKAFDSVSHRSLFHKLTKLKFPSNLVMLLMYGYVNQQMNVRWKTINTDYFFVKNGTRQGSVLSPYLFCIYIRDVSTEVINSKVGCHIAGKPVNILMYADDLVLLSPSWYAQQTLLDTCARAVTDLHMFFNTSKSFTMIFEPYRNSQRIMCVFPSFTLMSSQLKVVDNFKYLGHFISAKSGDNDDILHQMRLLFARTNVLLRKFNKCNTDVKLCLFKTYCMSFYGIATWHHYNVTVMMRFEAAYIKCVKMFFGYARLDSVTSMFFDLGLPTVGTIFHNARCRFAACVSSHDNSIIRLVHAICAF
jgi:hypothetical protein